MRTLRGDICDLNTTIIDFEAKEVFDSENFTDTDRKVLNYLCDLQSIYEIIAPNNDSKPCVACVLPCFPATMPTKYGYAYNSRDYFLLETAIIQSILRDGVSEVWIDLSQGLSIAFGKAVLRLKAHGFDVKLNVAIPYKGQGDSIFGESKSIYDKLIKKADVVYQVSTLPKAKGSFRNSILYMLEKSNILYIGNKELVSFYNDTIKNKNIEVKELKL